MKDLETKNLKIRKFKIEDAEDVYKNLATEEKFANCSGYNMHKNIYETKTMVTSYIKEYEMNELVWAIEEKETSMVIGYVRGLEVSRSDKCCDIKFGIALSYVDTRLMEEALKSVLDYLFNEEDFEIVISKFYDTNAEVTKFKTKTLKNIGMKQDAVLRNRKINEKTGDKENLIIYSIIKEEHMA